MIKDINQTDLHRSKPSSSAFNPGIATHIKELTFTRANDQTSRHQVQNKVLNENYPNCYACYP
jgi:hypothetical protein